MTALALLVVLALVFSVAWMNLAKTRALRAKLGPGGTNAEEPESVAVHQADKAQVLDLAPASDRDFEPPGAVTGDAGGDSKEKVLMKRPKRSRPGASDGHRNYSAANDPISDPYTRSPGDYKLAAGPKAGGQQPSTVIEGLDSANLSDANSLAEMAGELAVPPAGPAKDWSALSEEIPFPASYDEDATVALIRTPRSVYIYWERGGTGEADLTRQLGEDEFAGTVPVLRVWDEGRNIRNVDVHNLDDHWFLHEGLEPGHTYVFSYERRTPGGFYYRLSQTGPVSMPHDRPSEQTSAMLVQYFGGQPGHVPGSLRR